MTDTSSTMRALRGMEELKAFLSSIPQEGDKRLGILGGTFDPIHFGHLACASFAQEAAELDAVLFMPAGIPTFKQGRQIASAHERFAMVELALYDNDRFFLSSEEIDRSGVTYTIDTMRSLRSELPGDVELSFIIGADALLLLDEWKDIEELGQLVSFVCVARTGYVIDDELLTRLKGKGLSVEVIAAPLLDISSTEIRQRVSEGKTIRYLTPLAVCDFIRSHHLYEKEA